MSENRSRSRDTRGERSVYSAANDDDPPMSRLFIICNKNHTEDNFRDCFEKYGDIEDIWVVKDKQTQENKGIAYIKFAKTSDAARAQEEMNGTAIGHSDRPLKVLVAANRNQGSNKSDNEHEKYVRLFIVVPKTATELEIREEFSQYGNVVDVSLVKDRNTGNVKGFGYVRYERFYHAAVAFEQCQSKYRAVFAEPKSSARNLRSDQYSRNFDDSSYNNSRGANRAGESAGYNDYNNSNQSNNFSGDMAAFLRMQNVSVTQPTCLEIICSNIITQDQMWRLFDIIPGLDYCQILREYGPRTNEAIVVYDNPEAAIYAKEKLHGIEYPMGERIIVKVAGMSSTRMDTSFIDRRAKKDSICNVPLPPTADIAPPDAPVAQRLFIVLASNLPLSILKTVFSCFAGLIDVYLLPNKNCGYVKYARSDSAQRAIEILNGAEICGSKIKVMEAEERGENDNRKRLRRV